MLDEAIDVGYKKLLGVCAHEIPPWHTGTSKGGMKHEGRYTHCVEQRAKSSSGGATFRPESCALIGVWQSCICVSVNTHTHI